MREFRTDPQIAFPGTGMVQPEQAEIEHQRKEVAKLKMERDLLQRGAGYFTKETT